MKTKKPDPVETRKRWMSHFAAQRESGLTPTEYCKLKHIPPQNFYQARYRFKKAPRLKPLPRPGAFQKIETIPGTALPGSPSFVLLRAGTVQFEISETTSATFTAKLLQELNRGLA